MTDEDKTELWLQAPASRKYNLPHQCPTCKKLNGVFVPLRATYVYVGVFPYIHTDFTLECGMGHKFNFCMPYNKVMTAGYTVFDTKTSKKPSVEGKVCPFHEVPLEPIRLYGDLTFNDGKQKLQIRCPICYYSERVVIE